MKALYEVKKSLVADERLILLEGEQLSFLEQEDDLFYFEMTPKSRCVGMEVNLTAVEISKYLKFITE